MRQAIEEGIADCSAYVRGDGVALTAVADSTGRRRRRAARALSQASYDLDVDFEMTVIGAAYGYEDSDLDDLVAAIETNLTAHVNSGGLDASVSDAAAGLGLGDFAVDAPVQVISTSYTVVSVPTPPATTSRTRGLDARWQTHSSLP